MTRRKLPPRPSQKGGDYEVGYGRPPRETRFRPGQSGNPNGRPRGSKNRIPGMKEERLKTIILEEVYREIAVREGDRTITVPVIRAVVRTLANKGLKGETRALNRVLELVASIEEERLRLHMENFVEWIQYKQEWQDELRRRKKFAITDLQEPYPHPDDVILDIDTGDVIIRGPKTPEEKPKWDQARQYVRNIGECIAHLEQRAREEPDNEDLPRIIDSLRRKHAEYMKYIGTGRDET